MATPGDLAPVLNGKMASSCYTILSRYLDCTLQSKKRYLHRVSYAFYGSLGSAGTAVFDNCQISLLKVRGLKYVSLRIALKCHMIYIGKSQLRIV
jgi:hypothetical protein